MLIDILRMPPVWGIPLDRHKTIISGGDHIPTNPNAVVWRDVPIFRERLNVGTNINRTPKQLYKAIHLSDDYAYAFETVFSNEGDDLVCLYTKVIGVDGSRIGISLNAVKYYQADRHDLFPLPHFLISNRLPGIQSIVDANMVRTTPVENIVPPVFDLKLLWSIFDKSMRYGPEVVDQHIAKAYQPIYQYVPQVMEALIGGRFIRSPFNEFSEQHPSVEIRQDKWFSWQNIKYAVEARGLRVELNHAAFDEQALNMMLMFPTKFQVTSLMSHALDRINEVWTFGEYEDTYNSLTNAYFVDQRVRLTDIMMDCAFIYCQLFQIDSDLFLKNSLDKSSITLGKNIYDEIEVIIHDLISDRYICFYTSFPAVALTTLSVGWYN